MRRQMVRMLESIVPQQEREKRGRRKGEEREKKERRKGEESEKKERREGGEREKKVRRKSEEREKRGRREGEETYMSAIDPYVRGVSCKHPKAALMNFPLTLCCCVLSEMLKLAVPRKVCALLFLLAHYCQVQSFSTCSVI